MADIRHSRDDLYAEAASIYGTALDRLARAYEPDPDKRRDLLQEIHVAVWRSFENFAGRCSLKTWVYRVAHNTATSVVVGAVVAAFLTFFAKLNQRGARKLQRKIDELRG